MSKFMEDMFIEVREQKKFDDNILDLVYETVIGATQKSVVTEMAADKAREFVLSLPKFTPTEAWGKPESIEREQITKLFNAIGPSRARHTRYWAWKRLIMRTSTENIRKMNITQCLQSWQQNNLAIMNHACELKCGSIQMLQNMGARALINLTDLERTGSSF